MLVSLALPPFAAYPQALVESDKALLELIVSDSETREPIAARVRLRDQFGKDYVPDGAIEVPIARDRWFMTPGTVRATVAPGKLTVRVERGTEYQPVMESVKLVAGEPLRHKIALKRWIDLKKLGYAAGENHLHVSIRELGAMLAGEGLDFGNSLFWWNGPNLELPPGSDHIRWLSFGTTRIPASVFDAELEDAWGAVYLIGLKKPLDLPPDGKRPHLPVLRAAREQGALICYQAGWSREVLLDALLGLVDVVNVCNNNFHRHKFQPRRQYSNLLNVPGFPEYPDTPEGMMQMNTDTYYRLLNCGLRLAAGAESATGAKTTPAGYNRAYVRVEESTSLPPFLNSWRAGRNFVTDGPMVFLKVNTSKGPGDVIAFPAGGGALQVHAEALCNQPLRSLEIVMNGKVVARAAMGSKAFKENLDTTLKADKGAWLAARASAEDRLLSDEELARYVKIEGKPEEPCRLLFGHTSPVYVTVDGADAAVSESLREATQMLEAFERFAVKTAAEPYQAELTNAVGIAREKLKGRGNRSGHQYSDK